MIPDAFSAPHLEWFQDRWNLPESAVPLLEALMEARAGGSTALELPSPQEPGCFGNAALAIEPGADPAASPRPLVLLRHGGKSYLQPWIYYKAERDIATALRQRLQRAAASGVSPRLLDPLFPPGKQREAAQTALHAKLTLITGGPGTGKTYTIARILAALAETGIDPVKIQMAAPTGKAADRMKSAVAESLATLPPEFRKWSAPLDTMAAKSSTLHALLGYNPSTGRCRFNKENLLPCEALVVDECSMVDVLLWSALLAAVPEDALLILVGDPNQLESVGQGNVLTELVSQAASPSSPLHSSWVHLTETRRFQDRPGIIELADAFAERDGDRAVRLLAEARDLSAPAGIAWLEASDGSFRWNQFPPTIQATLTAVARAATPEAALQALKRVCILTAQRRYFVGALAMNAAIGEHFNRTAPEGTPPNQPIIVNHNDPETGLKNGSVGVIAPGPDGTRKAWFPGSDGGEALKSYALAQLPDYSPAWALTIHRSQGSEFDEVLVILPRKESPMATRELIYTAITRASKTVYLAGDIEAVRQAAETASKRVTLLGVHLAGNQIT